MTIALANTNAHNFTNAGVVNPITTSSTDMSGANFLSACSNCYTISGATPVVTDSLSNSWTPRTRYNDGSVNRSQACIHDTVNPTVSSSMTFTLTGSNYMAIFVAGFSGVDTSTPWESTDNGTSNSGTNTSIATGSINTVNNGALVVACFSPGNGTWSNLAIDTGFSITNQVANGATGSGAYAYLVKSTSGAVNPTWSWTTTTVGLDASIASYKPGAATASFQSPSIYQDKISSQQNFSNIFTQLSFIPPNENTPNLTSFMDNTDQMTGWW